MKSVIFSMLVLFGGSIFAQPGYKLFSSGANISSPKGKGGYVDQDGNKLVLICDYAPASEAQADVCLIKLGLSDQVLWSKKYKIPSTDEEGSPLIIENSDSYFVIGNTGYWPSQIDGLILKVRKSDGVCVMAKKFGGVSSDMFSSGIKTSPSSFTVCGFSLNNSFGSSFKGDGVILELSWNLDTLRTFRLGANNRFDQFNFIHQASNGNLLLLGTKSPPSGSTVTDNEDLTLVRLSSSWIPIFARSYHQPISGFEQPSSILEGLGGRIFLINKLPIVDETGILKLTSSGVLISSVAINNNIAVGSIFESGKLLTFGQNSSSKASVVFVDTSSFSSTLSRLYTFGSSSYALISSIRKIGSELVGFGFSHGITKATMFRSDEQGSIQYCDGLIDNTLATSPLLVDVTRTFPFLTGRFRYNGSLVSVTTEDITTNESVCNGSVLPVELVSFRGEVEVRGVNILWSTASERSVSHFVIEKSEDALRFDSIGFVEAVGNSVTLQDYGWLDEDARQGIRYYRLRSVDEDGAEEISSVVFVSFDLTVNKFSVFPNPASRKVTTRGTTGEVLIINTFGQIVGRQFAPDIDVGMLPKGVYTLLSLQTNDQVRLVVE